jgi:hypothetical protein
MGDDGKNDVFIAVGFMDGSKLGLGGWKER